MVFPKSIKSVHRRTTPQRIFQSTHVNLLTCVTFPQPNNSSDKIEHLWVWSFHPFRGFCWCRAGETNEPKCYQLRTYSHLSRANSIYFLCTSWTFAESHPRDYYRFPGTCKGSARGGNSGRGSCRLSVSSMIDKNKRDAHLQVVWIYFECVIKSWTWQDTKLWWVTQEFVQELTLLCS